MKIRLGFWLFRVRSITLICKILLKVYRHLFLCTVIPQALSPQYTSLLTSFFVTYAKKNMCKCRRHEHTTPGDHCDHSPKKLIEKNAQGISVREYFWRVTQIFEEEAKFTKKIFFSWQKIIRNWIKVKCVNSEKDFKSKLFLRVFFVLLSKSLQKAALGL